MTFMTSVKLALLAAALTSATAEQGPCPPGWHDGTVANANCYYTPGRDNKMDWDQAWNYCKTLRDGSFLAEPRTLDQLDFIGETVAAAYRPYIDTSLFHLGATDAFREGKWRWLETSEKLAALPRDDLWCPDQPDNWEDGEHCLNLKGAKAAAFETGTSPICLNDVPCSNSTAFGAPQLPPLCEMRPAFDKSWLSRWYRPWSAGVPVVMSALPPAEATLQCEVCQFLAKELGELTAEGRSGEQLTMAVNKSCERVSYVLPRGCPSLAAQHAGRIAELVAEGRPPHEVCALLRLCHGDLDRPPVLES